MAISKLKTRHAKGKRTIKQVITDCLDYDKNPDKTDNGKHVSFYACSPETAVEEWLLTKAIYEEETGRKQPKERDVISYFVLQSFKPDEITAKEANELGYQLAMEFTKGRHAFVVCTHTDREHIHNHIEFNSTNTDCDGKFHVHQSAMALQKINDKICLENGLSIIEKKSGKGKQYGEHRHTKQGTSYKDEIRKAIDRLLPSCNSLEELYAKLRQEDFSIKIGKYISIKAVGQERFTRTKTLGNSYTEQALQERIDECIRLKRRSKSQPIQTAEKQQKPFKSLINIAEKMAQGKHKGFEKWANIYNLKEYAKTYNFIMESGITTLEELTEKADKIESDFNAVSDKIKSLEKRMKEIGTLKHHIYNYSKTRDIYTQYRKAKDKAKFKVEHFDEIEKHLAAKEYFNSLGGEKLPKIAELQAEYETLLESKKALSGDYKTLKNTMLEYKTAKQNIERFLDTEQEEQRSDKQKDTER